MSTARPILFSAPMIRALLEGRKSQTRRTCSSARWWRHVDFVAGRGDDKNDPSNWGYADEYGDYWTLAKGPDSNALPCPYGTPGDKLWCRETHLLDPPIDGSWPTVGDTFEIGDIPERFRSSKHVIYRATVASDHGWTEEAAAAWRWRPSIFMPRWASRITLEITDVRVQRVQDISEEDAKAEGVTPMQITAEDLAEATSDSDTDRLVRALGEGQFTHRAEFEMLWREINGKRPGCAWKDNPFVWVIGLMRADALEGRE